MIASEQDRNCYGYTGPPYNPWPGWDNTFPAVCSTNNGTTTGEGPGQGNVQAIWTAYEWGDWESGGAGECNSREQNIIAEALCEVLARELHFTEVTYSNVSRTFDWGTFTDEANLNLSAASSVCGGQSFTINIDFTFPAGGNPYGRNDPRNKVLTGANHQYEWTAWDFANVDSGGGTGSMSITLFRRALRSDFANYVDITLTGANPPGTIGSFGGKGRVHFVCP